MKKNDVGGAYDSLRGEGGDAIKLMVNKTEGTAWKTNG